MCDSRSLPLTPIRGDFMLRGMKPSDIDRKTLDDLFAESPGGWPTDDQIINWLPEATIPEIQDILRQLTRRGRVHAVAMAALHVRLAELQKQPHWSVTPGFIVGCLAMVFAGIAAFPIIRSWLPPAPIADKSAIVQSPRLGSAQPSPASNKPSPPASNAVNHSSSNKSSLFKVNTN